MGLSDLSGSAAARMRPRGILRCCAVLALLCVCASATAENPEDNRFDAIIGATAARHNVDPLLIKAMVWHESRFRPLAQGKDGEIGLMQVKMDVVRDWAKARGEYNAGPGRVRRWIRQCGGDRERAISHSASSRYVRAIRDKYLAYTVQYAAFIASSGTERSNTPPSGLSEGSRL